MVGRCVATKDITEHLTSLCDWAITSGYTDGKLRRVLPKLSRIEQRVASVPESSTEAAGIASTNNELSSKSRRQHDATTTNCKSQPNCHKLTVIGKRPVAIRIIRRTAFLVTQNV